MRWTPTYNHLRTPHFRRGTFLAATYQNSDTDAFLDPDTLRAREAAAEVGLDWKKIPHFDDYIPDICGTLDHEDEVTVTVHQMLGKYREHPLLDEEISSITESITILGAYLHDRGKLCLDQEILYQPTTDLSPDDKEHIRQHPVYSEALLRSKNVTFFNKKLEELNEKHGWNYPLLPTDDPNLVPAIAKAVRHHHENFDGTGYPDAKIGKDIPLSARIIAAADRHHAQTQKRCYKLGMSGTVALQLVTQQASGRIENAHLIALFLSKATPQQQYILFREKATVTTADVLNFDWGKIQKTPTIQIGHHHLRPMGIGLHAATSPRAPAPAS